MTSPPSSAATQALEVESLRDAPVCAKCRSDDSNYMDPLSKLAWARTCRHGLCERCRKDLFSRHRTNRCPVQGCADTVTQSDYVPDTREASEFKRECDVRKRLARIFNKRPGDFNGDARAYNDYLETVERYICVLVTGSPDEQREVDTAIAAYQAENARSIAANAAAADAASRREEQRAKEEAAARSEAALKAAREHAERKVAAEALRQRIFSVLAAVRDDGPALNDAQRAAYKAELTELRGKLQAAQNALTAAAASAEAAAASASASATAAPLPIPCALVFPPRLLAEVNAAIAHLSLPALPPAIIARQQRAGGLTNHDKERWAAEEVAEELWP